MPCDTLLLAAFGNLSAQISVGMCPAINLSTLRYCHAIDGQARPINAVKLLHDFVMKKLVLSHLVSLLDKPLRLSDVKEMLEEMRKLVS